MWLKSLVTRCWARSKTICSARSTRSVVSPGRSCPSRAISDAGADEAAQRRHLTHDPRVVGRVRRRRHERRELVDPRAAADLLELAALLERVDERDRVDRLALLVEREAGAEDDSVALAVEVLRGEDLGDRADRARARAASLRAPTPPPRGSAAARAAWRRERRRPGPSNVLLQPPRRTASRLGIHRRLWDAEAAICREKKRLFASFSTTPGQAALPLSTRDSSASAGASGKFTACSTGLWNTLWKTLRLLGSSVLGSRSPARLGARPRGSARGCGLGVDGLRLRLSSASTSSSASARWASTSASSAAAPRPRQPPSPPAPPPAAARRPRE